MGGASTSNTNPNVIMGKTVIGVSNSSTGAKNWDEEDFTSFKRGYLLLASQITADLWKCRTEHHVGDITLLLICCICQ